MDTLSSSLPTLKLPSFSSPTRELHTHFKLPPPHLPSSKPNNPLPFISTKPPLKPRHPPAPTTLPSCASSHPPGPGNCLSPPDYVHRRPATGYAAALLDIARCRGTLEILANDVQRLKKLLLSEQVGAVLGDPLVGARVKGTVVKEMVRSGKYDGVLVGLVKMLVKRDRVGMVGEVLMEFERIYDELSGTQVVLVSSKKKIREDGLLGIATRIKELSGAVKVKVWNFVGEKSALFAVT